MGKEGVASFIKVEDKEIQFIEIERTILLEAINVTWKTTQIGRASCRERVCAIV